MTNWILSSNSYFEFVDKNQLNKEGPNLYGIQKIPSQKLELLANYNPLFFQSHKKQISITLPDKINEKIDNITIDRLLSKIQAPVDQFSQFSIKSKFLKSNSSNEYILLFKGLFTGPPGRLNPTLLESDECYFLGTGNPEIDKYQKNKTEGRKSFNFKKISDGVSLNLSKSLITENGTSYQAIPFEYSHLPFLTNIIYKTWYSNYFKQFNSFYDFSDSLTDEPIHYPREADDSFIYRPETWIIPTNVLKSNKKIEFELPEKVILKVFGGEIKINFTEITYQEILDTLKSISNKEMSHLLFEEDFEEQGFNQVQYKGVKTNIGNLVLNFSKEEL